MAKLRAEDVIEIREKYNTDKFTYKNLSKIYKVSKGTIGDIVKYRSWKHINPEKCPTKDYKGQLRGGDAPWSKLTEKEVNFIRKEHKKGNITQKELSNKFNISQTTTSDIINYRRWTHI
jgi:uncharacterized membrane protein